VLLWWLEKVPKNISQMVVKHGDLPWDRIRKKSPTTTQLIDGNIFTSKKTRPWHAPWKVRPISHGSVLMAKDSSFPKAASTHPRPDNILDVTL